MPDIIMNLIAVFFAGREVKEDIENGAIVLEDLPPSVQRLVRAVERF